MSPRREISVLSCLDAVAVDDSEAVGSQMEGGWVAAAAAEDSVVVEDSEAVDPFR